MRVEPWGAASDPPPWAERVPGTTLAFRWGELVAGAVGDGFEHRGWTIGEPGRPRAIAAVHVLRRVDLAGYVGGGLARLLKPAARLGWRPLALDIAFCELPLLHLPGLLFHPDVDDAERVEIWRALLATIRATLDVDLFVARVDPGSAEAVCGDLPIVPFLANYVLPRPPGGWSTWRDGLGYKMRKRVRKDLRCLLGAGGEVQIRLDDLPAAPAMMRLHAETASRHAAAGELEHPIAIGEALLKRVGSLPRGDRAVLWLEVAGEPAGFSIALRAGRRLLLRTTGMDAVRAKPAHGYFNLDYAAIELAEQLGCDEIDLGPTTPEPKIRIGARPQASAYLVDFRSLLLRPLRHLVAARFGTASARS